MLRMILIFSLAAAALPAFAEPTDESGGGRRPQAAALEEPTDESGGGRRPQAAVLEEQPAAASEAQPLRRVVALLDYVSGDYPRAVGPNGEVLSAAEHQEQIGFVQDAARELRAAVDGKGEDLAQRLDALGKLVAARGPPDRVASQAREVRDQIVQRFQVVLRPLKP